MSNPKERTIASEMQPTQKQIRFASEIAKALNIELPKGKSLEDYAIFIAENLEKFRKQQGKQKQKEKNKKLKEGLLIQEVEPRLYLKKLGTQKVGQMLTSVNDAIQFMQKHVKGLDRERLICMTLTGDNTVINMSTVSIGTIDQTIAVGREIFKVAILSNAAKIILFHNHPDVDDARPSPEDVFMTKNCITIGKFLGIPLIDHIILSGDYTYSFQEESMLF